MFSFRYFLALVFDYMLIVEKCLNDIAQRMIFYHLVHRVCQFHRAGQVQIKINQLRKKSNEDEKVFYKNLFQNSGNARKETEIRKLLNEKDWIQQTIDILSEN